MIRLIINEIKRKKTIFYGFFTALVLIELYGFAKYDEPYVLFTVIPLTMLMLLILIITNVNLFRRDINTNEGYMIMMTPKSGYEIMIMKFCTAFIEFSIVLGIGAIISKININHISSVEIIHMGGSIFGNMNFSFILKEGINCLVLISNSYALLLMLLVVFKSGILSKLPFKKLILIVVYLYINGILTSIVSSDENKMIAIAAFFPVIFIYVAGNLLEKHIDL